MLFFVLMLSVIVFLDLRQCDVARVYNLTHLSPLVAKLLLAQIIMLSWCEIIFFLFVSTLVFISLVSIFAWQRKRKPVNTNV